MSKTSSKSWLEIIVYLGSAIAFLAVVVVWLACVSPTPADAERVLKQQGYTDIKMTGYRPFMGGENDFVSYGFEAKSQNGQRVTGAVTGGPAKGLTVRFD